MRCNHQKLMTFLRACLDDDDGISDKAMIALRDLASTYDGKKENKDELTALLGIVDATDGRFYVKSDA